MRTLMVAATLLLGLILNTPAWSRDDCTGAFLICSMGCSGNQGCLRGCASQSKACRSAASNDDEEEDDAADRRRREMQLEQQRQQSYEQEQRRQQQQEWLRQQELQRQQTNQQQLEYQRQQNYQRQLELQRQQELQRRQVQQIPQESPAPRQQHETTRNDPRAFATECIQQVKNTTTRYQSGVHQRLTLFNKCGFNIWFFGVTADHSEGAGGLIPAGDTREFVYIERGKGLMKHFKACNPKYDKDHYCAGKADGLGGPLY